MTHHRTVLVALVVLALGCPSDDDGPPSISDVAGAYNIALQLLDNSCFDFDYDDLMAFTLESNAARSMSIELSQDGSALVGLTGPDVICELVGSVGTSGTWNLSGPCDDDLMDRALRVSATSTPYGDGLDLDGRLVFDVDGDPDMPGAADGTIDCEVEHRLQGTGTPSD
jgi:hypothetical protein